jgi:hypothetical protein
MEETTSNEMERRRPLTANVDWPLLSFWIVYFSMLVGLCRILF